MTTPANNSSEAGVLPPLPSFLDEGNARARWDHLWTNIASQDQQNNHTAQPQPPPTTSASSRSSPSGIELSNNRATLPQELIRTESVASSINVTEDQRAPATMSSSASAHHTTELPPAAFSTSSQYQGQSFNNNQVRQESSSAVVPSEFPFQYQMDYSLPATYPGSLPSQHLNHTGMQGHQNDQTQDSMGTSLLRNRMSLELPPPILGPPRQSKSSLMSNWPSNYPLDREQPATGFDPSASTDWASSSSTPAQHYHTQPPPATWQTQAYVDRVLASCSSDGYQSSTGLLATSMQSTTYSSSASSPLSTLPSDPTNNSNAIWPRLLFTNAPNRGPSTDHLLAGSPQPNTLAYQGSSGSSNGGGDALNFSPLAPFGHLNGNFHNSSQAAHRVSVSSASSAASNVAMAPSDFNKALWQRSQGRGDASDQSVYGRRESTATTWSTESGDELGVGPSSLSLPSSSTMPSPLTSRTRSGHQLQQSYLGSQRSTTSSTSTRTTTAANTSKKRRPGHSPYELEKTCTDFRFFKEITLPGDQFEDPVPYQTRTDATPRRDPPRSDFQGEDESTRATSQEPKLGEGDLYTPRFVKGARTNRQGWCDCGEWLGMKSSVYNWHVTTRHGISCRTGRPFAPPLQIRYCAALKLADGWCGNCQQWINIMRKMQRERSFKGWFIHAAACSHKNHRITRPMPPTMGVPEASTSALPVATTSTSSLLTGVAGGSAGQAYAAMALNRSNFAAIGTSGQTVVGQLGTAIASEDEEEDEDEEEVRLNKTLTAKRARR